MKLTPAAILLAALTAPSAFAQTTAHPPTTARRPVHRSTPAAAPTPAAAAADPADTPPNVPRIEGAPKPLYALRYVDTVVGAGPLAEPRKWYTVNYTGWLTDGTQFDSSVGKAPISFPYGARRVIIGWDTGFEGMHIGGKRRLYIPYQLAYGEPGRPGIPPKANLIFDVELVSISDTDPNAPPVSPTVPDSARPTTEPTQPTDPTKPTSAPPPPSSNPSTTPTAPTSPK